MKWLLVVLLVSGATAAPAIAWEKDTPSTDVIAVSGGAIAFGNTSTLYDSAGNQLATFPTGTWANGYLANGWYNLAGNRIGDVTTPDYSHESGVLSYGAEHKVFENGQQLRSWTSKTCTGEEFTARGQTGFADLAYGNDSLALNGKWSASPGNIFSAGLQNGGVTVLFNNGKISHYAADTACDGAPSWETEQTQKPLKVWFQEQTYVLYNSTLFGGTIKAFNSAGQLVWEKPAPLVHDLVETAESVVVAQNQLVWLNKATGATEHRLPISAVAVTATGEQVYAVGQKVWSITTIQPTSSSSSEAVPESSSDVIVIPAPFATVIIALAILARRH